MEGEWGDGLTSNVSEATKELELPRAVEIAGGDAYDDKKRTKGGKILAVVAVVLFGVLVLTGGMLTGVLLQRQNDMNDRTQLGETPALDQLLDGSGGGKLVGDVALMPNDDKLTLELLKMHNEKENSCYSPLSIRYALKMMWLGSSGETKAQIGNLLGASEMTPYENVAEHMNIANSLWIKDDFAGEVKADYQNALEETLGAVVQRDSFQTAEEINDWVDRNSFGMLKDVLQDDDVQGLKAALVNVLAIDMNWQQEFDENNTSGQYFNYAGDDEDERYTMMQGEGGDNVYYNLAADATVLALDLKEYGDTRLQFVAIMPSDDLTEFIREVSVEQVNRLLAGLRQAVRQNSTYDFGFLSYLPKFSMQSGIDDLRGDLAMLGVTDAFDIEKADFSNLTDTPFVIEQMIHKTNFDLSEEGIKAAAVTIGGGKGAGGDGPIPSSALIVVSINKPFMYLVRDVKTGEVWFTGTVYEPNLWEDDQAMYAY